MGRVLIVLGLLLVVAGVMWVLGVPLPLGRLPGDYVFRRGAMRVYVPVTSALLVSALLSLLLWLFRR